MANRNRLRSPQNIHEKFSSAAPWHSIVTLSSASFNTNRAQAYIEFPNVANYVEVRNLGISLTDSGSVSVLVHHASHASSSNVFSGSGLGHTVTGGGYYRILRAANEAVNFATPQNGIFVSLLNNTSNATVEVYAELTNERVFYEAGPSVREDNLAVVTGSGITG